METVEGATVRFGDGQVELQVPDMWLLSTSHSTFVLLFESLWVPA